MKDKWIKWIYASIVKHFKDNRSVTNLFIEGDDRLQDQEEGAELSINGPYFKNTSRRFWTLDLDIQILINTFINDQSIYRAKVQQGLYVSLYSPTINVYKYGDGDEYLGCLILNSEINVDNVGQISPEMRVIQSLIYALYTIELTED